MEKKPTTIEQTLERMEQLIMRAHEALPASYSEIAAQMQTEIKKISDRQAERIEADNKYYEKVNTHMARVEPVLKAYEAAQDVGWLGAKIAGIGLTIGAMYLMARQIFH
jgi:ribosome-binding protein aMBF1 (putative translation factor)